jgi:hypothetical protein
LWVADRNGETRLIDTPYEVRHDEWDPVEGTLVSAEGEVGGEESARLRQLRGWAERMDDDLRRMREIVDELDALYSSDPLLYPLDSFDYSLDLLGGVGTWSVDRAVSRWLAVEVPA